MAVLIKWKSHKSKPQVNVDIDYKMQTSYLNSQILRQYQPLDKFKFNYTKLSKDIENSFKSDLTPKPKKMWFKSKEKWCYKQKHKNGDLGESSFHSFQNNMSKDSTKHSKILLINKIE